jgi:hypothetical protein
MEKHWLSKYFFIAVGGFLSMLQDITMLLVVCTLAVVLDCISAISLAHRVKKMGKGTGKVTSEKGSKIINTLATIYSLIAFAYLLDNYVATMFDM